MVQSIHFRDRGTIGAPAGKRRAGLRGGARALLALQSFQAKGRLSDLAGMRPRAGGKERALLSDLLPAQIPAVQTTSTALKPHQTEPDIIAQTCSIA